MSPEASIDVAPEVRARLVALVMQLGARPSPHWAVLLLCARLEWALQPEPGPDIITHDLLFEVVGPCSKSVYQQTCRRVYAVLPAGEAVNWSAGLALTPADRHRVRLWLQQFLTCAKRILNGCEANRSAAVRLLFGLRMQGHPGNIRGLIQMTGLTKAQIHRGLRALQDHHLITRVPRGRDGLRVIVTESA